MGFENWTPKLFWMGGFMFIKKNCGWDCYLCYSISLRMLLAHYMN